MSRAIPFLLLLACGDNERLRGTLSLCQQDADCRVGEICAAAEKVCVAVDLSDPANWPKPSDSAEMLEQLGPLVFVAPEQSTNALMEIDLTLLSSRAVHIADSVSAATVRSRLKDGVLRVWNMRALAPGGTFSVGDDPPIYLMNLELSSDDEARGELITDDYPRAHMSTRTSMTLRGELGASADALAPFELHFDAMQVDCRFNLENHTLVAEVSFAGAWTLPGVSQILTIDSLRVTGTLEGARVPESW